MHLFIIRHGQCEFAADGPLTSEGEHYSRQVAARLAGIGITHILSSPLLRALGTASIIAESCNKPIQVWLELREGFDDPHRGLSRSELQSRFPSSVLPPTISEEGWPHGGDNYASFFARCQQTLALIQEGFGDDDRLALVTHGGFSNYFLHAILQIPSSAPQWFELDYCAITHLRFVPDGERRNWPLYPAMGVEILSVNDVSHLRISS